MGNLDIRPKPTLGYYDRKSNAENGFADPPEEAERIRLEKEATEAKKEGGEELQKKEDGLRAKEGGRRETEDEGGEQRKGIDGPRANRPRSIAQGGESDGSDAGNFPTVSPLCHHLRRRDRPMRTGSEPID